MQLVLAINKQCRIIDSARLSNRINHIPNWILEVDFKVEDLVKRLVDYSKRSSVQLRHLFD